MKEDNFEPGMKVTTRKGIFNERSRAVTIGELLAICKVPMMSSSGPVKPLEVLLVKRFGGDYKGYLRSELKPVREVIPKRKQAAKKAGPRQSRP